MDESQEYDERAARHKTRSLPIGTFIAAAGLGLTLGGGLVNLYDGVRVGIADNASELAVLTSQCLDSREAIKQLDGDIYQLERDALAAGREIAELASTVERLRAVSDARPDALSREDATRIHEEFRAAIDLLAQRVSQLEGML